MTDTPRKPVSITAGGPSVMNDPQRIDELYVEASTFLIRGDYQTAKERFLQILERKPDHHASRYNLAKIALDSRAYDEAIRYGTEAIGGDPDNYWYYELVARAYAAKGSYDQAVEIQSQLIKRFPGKEADYLYLADWQIKNQKLDEAEEILELGIQRFKQSARLNQSQYNLYAKQEKWEAALTVANRLQKQDPTNPQYVQLQYEALEALGRESEAVSLLQSLQTQQTDNAYIQLTLAKYYGQDAIKAGKLAAGVPSLQEAFENPDISAADKLALLDSFMKMIDQEDQASLGYIQALAQLIQRIHPNSGAGLSILGRIYTLNGAVDSAMSLYRQSLVANPQDLSLWEELLSDGWNSFQLEIMQQDAEEALTYYPSKDLFNYYYGLAATYRAAWGEASFAVKKVERTGSPDPDVQIDINGLIGLFEMLQGDASIGQDKLVKLIAAHPNRPKLHHHLSFAYQQQGNQTAALKAAEKAHKLDPEKVIYLAQLASVLLADGKANQALPHIEKAASLAQTAAIYELWGDALHQLSRDEEATQKWQIAQQKGAKLSIDRKLGQ